MDPSFVTDIDVVISDARIWARSAARHADVVPTVMPVPDGIVVGAPVGPMQPSVSALALADSAWIGFEPDPLSSTAATDAVVDQVLAGLAPTPPGATIGVAHPSSWSAARRSLVGRSFGRYSSSVLLEPVAVRVAKLRQSLATSELVVVVEIEPLDVTVSAINRSRDQIEVLACEHEPTLGEDEWHDVAVERLMAMIRTVLDGCRPSSVLVLGRHDEPLLQRLRDFTAESWTAQPPPLVQPTAFTALLLPQSSLDTQQGRSEQNAEWVGTLRERAAATTPSPRGALAKVVGAAAVLLTVITVSVVALVVTTGNGADAASIAGSTVSGDPTASATQLRTPTTAASPSAQPSPDQPAEASKHHVLGRVAFDFPEDWRIGDESITERVTVVPKTAIPGRITVTYNTVAEQAGYDEVLRDITARIASTEPGRFSAPERDVVFAGRRGIGYQELPDDGSVVRWYVLLDHGVQANIGCQHGSGGWGTVSTACEEVMRTVSISP